MNLTALIANLVALSKASLPFLGAQAHEPIERAVTIPEKEIKKMCKGMSEEDTKEAVSLFREAADKWSDAIVFVASRGTVDPD